MLHNAYFFNVAADAGDAWNLGFAFLDLNGGAAPNFDPNAIGEYTFFLAAYEHIDISTAAGNNNCGTLTAPTYCAGLGGAAPTAQLNPNAPGFGTFQGKVAIQVNVVPEPSTYALMTLGLGALGFAARRRRNTVTIA